MSAPSIVMIATRERLEPLRARVSPHGEVVALTETDVPRAVEILASRTPTQLIVERFFAATPRGAALISRLRSDPAMANLEIRVAAHDSDYSRVVEHRADASESTTGQAPISNPAAAILDRTGTRRSPRMVPPEGVEVLIDGKPVVLVNLAEGGAQVTSPAVLRPNQRVRVSIAWQQEVARVGATITWANFEMSKEAGRPQYRAGLTFNPGETDIIEGLTEKWGD